jgi:hypothetical protein
MKQTFLVKHAIGGRAFIDTNKDEVSYTVASDGEGWLFTVEVAWGEAVAELLAHKDELNVFIFKEYDDQPTLKTWYYVKQGSVVYDADQGALKIAAQSRIEYYPHQYST